MNAAATSSQQANAANNQLSSSSAGITNTSNNANFATPQTVNAGDGMTANMTGNEPIHFGGLIIQDGVGGKKWYYSNSKLEDAYGTAYAGTDIEIIALRDALMKLQKASPTYGSAVITDLQNAPLPFEYNIIANHKRNEQILANLTTPSDVLGCPDGSNGFRACDPMKETTSAKVEMYEDSDSKTGMSASIKSNVLEGYITNPSLEAILIHELTHAWHARWGVWQKLPNDEEIETMYVENLVRVEMGLPITVSYVGKSDMVIKLYKVTETGDIISKKKTPIHKQKLNYNWKSTERRVFR